MLALSLGRSWKFGWALRLPNGQCRSVAAGARKHRVAFLGTPQVATIPLIGLLEAANRDYGSEFEVVAVVSQPPRSRGRGKKPPQPSPVHQAALSADFPQSAILTPVKEQFLSELAALEPDLCITAAYGNMLPQKLLDMPRCGTLNIHPSLLPKYRGAAPVNRCLENGDAVTGVSVAYTVLKCDAGPVLAQQELALQGNEQAPELLDKLFSMGTKLLIEKLPEVWSGEAETTAVPQDEACATHAAKMTKQDGLLDFSQPAQTLHNKVRGFSGWPGTWAKICISQEGKGDVLQDLKIQATKVLSTEECQRLSPVAIVSDPACMVVGTCGEGLLLRCGDGKTLLATSVQAPGKAACCAAAFGNGHNGKRISLVR